MDSKKLAAGVQQDVVAFRHELHAHPELSFQEVETTNRIAAALEGLGLTVTRFAPTGLMADIKGGKPGKMVGLRADIDALPVTEHTDLPFASTVPGVMHACGHDTHAAMLYGAAKVLCSVKGELPGTVRLLFQPAEEIVKGAKALVQQGALDGVDMLFGQHIIGMMPVGVLGVSAGPSAAASDAFIIKVHGKGCHGAMPDTGVDATLAASAIVVGLQSIVSREIAPAEPAVVTVGKLVSGTKGNIISGEAEMEGTVRTFDRALRKTMPDRITRIAKDIASAYRCTAEVEYEFSVDVLINDEAATAVAAGAAKKVVAAPAMLLQNLPRQMGAEDFADYTAKVPASFAVLGGGGEYPQHSDKFCIDEAAFETGVAFLVQAAWDFLTGAQG
jgi:amidohydrolase